MGVGFITTRLPTLISSDRGFLVRRLELCCGEDTGEGCEIVGQNKRTSCLSHCGNTSPRVNTWPEFQKESYKEIIDILVYV